MKKWRILAALMLVLAMTAGTVETAFAAAQEAETTEAETTEAADADYAEDEEEPADAEETAEAEETVEENEAADTEETAEAEVEMPPIPDFSTGLDENGWLTDTGLTELVELPEYAGAEFAAADVTISDEELQAEIDELLAGYAGEPAQITDRAVADGDSVNIDYVGSIDGVEFDGGNTMGQGTTVTIGVTQYIDDFLEQLIGHMPGDTFDVNVTFPENYGVENLNGKDAVFVTTINYIEEPVIPEWNDEFVAENLQEMYGYESAADAEVKLRADLERSKGNAFVWNWLMENSTFTAEPESQLQNQIQLAVDYYKWFAAAYGIDFETYLTYMGIADEEALRDSIREEALLFAERQVVSEKIAKEQGIDIDDAYVAEQVGDNLDAMVENYGIGYIMNNLRMVKVAEWVLENATIAGE